MLETGSKPRLPLHLLTLALALASGPGAGAEEARPLPAQGGPWAHVASPAKARSAMGIEFLAQDSARPAAAQGGLWSTLTYAYMAHAKEFGPRYDPKADSPLITDFSVAFNTGSTGSVLARLANSHCMTSNTTCFGDNVIVSSEAGIKNPKLVALELDVQPSKGVPVSTQSGGLFINAFSSTIPVALMIDGVFGGHWTNGITMGNMDTGLSGTAGETLGTLINTGAATYTASPVILSNTHHLQFSGGNADGTNAFIYNTTTDDLMFVTAGRGFAFRNPGDTKTVAYLDAGGNFVATSYRGTLGTPASSRAPCTAGTFLDDADFHYVCVATNRWKRVALSTF